LSSKASAAQKRSRAPTGQGRHPSKRRATPSSALPNSPPRPPSTHRPGPEHVFSSPCYKTRCALRPALRLRYKTQQIKRVFLRALRKGHRGTIDLRASASICAPQRVSLVSALFFICKPAPSRDMPSQFNKPTRLWIAERATGKPHMVLTGLSSESAYSRRFG